MKDRFNKTIEECVIGHLDARARELHAKIEGTILKLSDECICLDMSSFFDATDKKYAELFQSILSSFQTTLVYIFIHCS